MIHDHGISNLVKSVHVNNLIVKQTSIKYQLLICYYKGSCLLRTWYILINDHYIFLLINTDEGTAVKHYSTTLNPTYWKIFLISFHLSISVYELIYKLLLKPILSLSVWFFVYSLFLLELSLSVWFRIWVEFYFMKTLCINLAFIHQSTLLIII